MEKDIKVIKWAGTWCLGIKEVGKSSKTFVYDEGGGAFLVF